MAKRDAKDTAKFKGVPGRLGSKRQTKKPETGAKTVRPIPKNVMTLKDFNTAVEKSRKETKKRK